MTMALSMLMCSRFAWKARTGRKTLPLPLPNRPLGKHRRLQAELSALLGPFGKNVGRPRKPREDLSDTKLPGKRPWTGVATGKRPEMHNRLPVSQCKYLQNTPDMHQHTRFTTNRRNLLTN